LCRKTRGTDQESNKGRTIIMAGIGKRTRLGTALEQSAKEILAHVKGDARLSTRRIVLPDEVDVKRIRTKARMSQTEFARAFCINPRTLQEWEQGRRKPDATTRAYLAVIAKNREAVLDALAS
jgi:putative transcriptional regulator